MSMTGDRLKAFYAEKARLVGEVLAAYKDLLENGNPGAWDHYVEEIESIVDDAMTVGFQYGETDYMKG
jgi:hypothetical protein